jgi:hypothetical protein
MSISNDTAKSLAIALTSNDKADSVSDHANKATSSWDQSSHVIVDSIIATSTSTTVDFGSLRVGDLVITIPAVDSTMQFEMVTVDKTKPSPAQSGDLYLVLRHATLSPDTSSNDPLVSSVHDDAKSLVESGFLSFYGQTATEIYGSNPFASIEDLAALCQSLGSTAGSSEDIIYCFVTGVGLGTGLSQEAMINSIDGLIEYGATVNDMPPGFTSGGVCSGG